MISSWYNKSRKMSVKSMIGCPIQELLTSRVYIRIFTVLVCSSVVIGQFDGNKYMNSEVISVLGNIGPTMCTNKCKSLYGCNGMNYDRHHLTCELLRIDPTTDDISEKAGSMFVGLPSLQPINATACWHNPCSQNNKCIVSRQNKAFCIQVTKVGEFFVKTIMSTNYPAAYPNNEMQSWSLAVDYNARLILKFKAFNMEAGADNLKIYDRLDGIQLYSLTGSLNQDDIWSEANGFNITFTSDSSITSSGFSINVYHVYTTA